MAVVNVCCIVAGVMVMTLLAGVDGRLSLNRKCGEKTCATGEFCSAFDNICRPCESVCELGSHNYQEDTCEKDCQDYLHDRLYMRQDTGSLHEDIQQLYMLVTVVLVIVVIILVVVVGVLAFFFLRAKKQNSALAEKIRKKMSTINALQGNNNVVKDADPAVEPPRSVAYKIDGGALRLDMGSASAGAATSTLSNGRPPRYPSEDATLEYGGYDNPGLHVTPSPVFDKDGMMTTSTKRESSF